MDPEWVQVRLRRKTMERLKRWESKTLAKVHLLKDGSAPNHLGQIGHDVAIGILLARDEAHQARSAKSRKKRKPPLDTEG